jgi:hypothetical protein
MLSERTRTTSRNLSASRERAVTCFCVSTSIPCQRRVCALGHEAGSVECFSFDSVEVAGVWEEEEDVEEDLRRITVEHGERRLHGYFVPLKALSAYARTSQRCRRRNKALELGFTDEKREECSQGAGRLAEAVG